MTNKRSARDGEYGEGPWWPAAPDADAERQSHLTPGPRHPSFPPPNGQRYPTAPPPGARYPTAPPPPGVQHPSFPPPAGVRHPTFAPPPNGARHPSFPPPNGAIRRDALADKPTEIVPAFPRRGGRGARRELMERERRKQVELIPTRRMPVPAQSTEMLRRQELDYYRVWLKSERQRQAGAYAESARQEFMDHAQRPVKFRRQTVLPFAPVQRVHSAMTTMTVGQMIVFAALLGITIAGLYLSGVVTLIVFLGIITAAYLVNIVLTAATAASVISSAPEEHFDEHLLAALHDADWPTYTILCPLYREVAVVPQFVAAMQAIDYPADRLQIVFLTESDDEATRQAIQDLHLPAQFEIITVPDGQPRTKPRACNYGLLKAWGGFIVTYDAEDVPDRLQLKKAVLSFASHDGSLACVQAKLDFYNIKQNVLTRWFGIEYALWFNITLPGLARARLSLPLGGTSNHFRTDVLRRLGGWDAFNVTEDCDLGLRLSERRLYTVILDSVTLEEANSNVRNWIRQRSRWIKGYMQTFLVHLRHPWRYVIKRRPRTFFSLFAIIGGTPATFIVNPIMWVLLLGYIVSRQTFGPELRVLYIAPIFYPAVVCLVAGNFLYLYLSLIACVRSQHYGLMPWVITMPICWLLMCVAAFMALTQLIYKPHYWEKTRHGLHLKHVAGTGAPESGARAGTEWSAMR